MTSEFIFGKIRVQLLSEDIVRVEYARKGKFWDDNSFFIPDRKAFSGADGVAYGNIVTFGDGYALSVPEACRSLAGVKLTRNGSSVYSYKKLQNSGTLPALDKTPEVFALADNPRIFVPEGGYAYRGKRRNSGYRVEEDVQDVYLLLCRKDAKKLRKLYTELTGRCELVRLSVLGGWNSKYYEYDEQSAKQLILDYEQKGVPLDVMVIDTDWRQCMEKGTGYEVNRTLFPDLKRLFRFAHEHGVEIVFNDHPEPVSGTDSVFSPEEVKYRSQNLMALLKQGLDGWWYDRNWSVSLLSPTPAVPCETFGFYLYSEICGQYFKKRDGERCARPIVMGNVAEVMHGEYRGILDSASHRYGIQWTGDIPSDAPSLRREIENLLRCSANGIVYVNSDCGGHLGNPDRELFVRWMQFGALSPVFRPHCTKGLERTREPWVYDEEVLNIVREYALLRYRLLPVFYRSAYGAYLTGEPICKSLGFEYPSDKRALRCTDAYMLGRNLLISPISEGDNGEKETYLPAGKWIDLFDGKPYMGGKTVKKKYSLRHMPLFVRAGALLPLAENAQNTKRQPHDKLILEFFPDMNSGDAGDLYEDDGVTVAYRRGEYRRTMYEASYDSALSAYTVRLHAAAGTFQGERAVSCRQVELRYHCLKGTDHVKKVTVNGKEAAFERIKKNPSAFPLQTGAAPDSDILCVRFSAPVDSAHVIKFLLD